MITNGRSGSLFVEEGKILTNIEERRKQEEILWKKKSWVQWLWEGERNAHFFHKAMVQHRQHNRIFSLLKPGGNILVQHEDMGNLLVNNFQNTMLEPLHDRSKVIDRITRHIPQLVNGDQNLALMPVVIL